VGKKRKYGPILSVPETQSQWRSGTPLPRYTLPVSPVGSIRDAFPQGGKIEKGLKDRGREEERLLEGADGGTSADAKECRGNTDI